MAKADQLQFWQISNMFDIYTDHNRPKQTQADCSGHFLETDPQKTLIGSFRRMVGQGHNITISIQLPSGPVRVKIQGQNKVK